GHSAREPHRRRDAEGGRGGPRGLPQERPDARGGRAGQAHRGGWDGSLGGAHLRQGRPAQRLHLLDRGPRLSPEGRGPLPGGDPGSGSRGRTDLAPAGPPAGHGRRAVLAIRSGGTPMSRRRSLSTLGLLLLALGCAPRKPPQPPAAVAPAPAPAAWRGTRPGPRADVPPFRAPVPTQRSLPNRLPVLLRENHAVPIVVVELAIKTGVDGDPPDRPGLADFVAGALDEGTRSRTSQQLAEQLEDLAASLSVNPGLDGIRLHLNRLSPTLEP